MATIGTERRWQPHVSARTGTAEMGKPVYTTAIAVIPPEDVWPAIQAIRTEHDAKVRRWMPHPGIPLRTLDVREASMNRLPPRRPAWVPRHAHGLPQSGS